MDFSHEGRRILRIEIKHLNMNMINGDMVLKLSDRKRWRVHVIRLNSEIPSGLSEVESFEQPTSFFVSQNFHPPDFVFRHDVHEYSIQHRDDRCFC